MRVCGAWIACAVVLLGIVVSNVVSAQEATAPSETPQSPPAPPPTEPEPIPAPPSTYGPPPAPAPATSVQAQSVSASQADFWPAQVEAPPPLERAASLTFAPLSVILGPVVELTLEVAASEAVGIALIAGVGLLSVKTIDAELSATVLELGASFRYYAVGDFSTGGLQLGAEVLYVHVFVDGEVDGDSVSATGAGLGVGPMIGYKYVAERGFTFDGQLGVMWTVHHAESDTESTDVTAIRPLLNVNFGLSF